MRARVLSAVSAALVTSCLVPIGDVEDDGTGGTSGTSAGGAGAATDGGGASGSAGLDASAGSGGSGALGGGGGSSGGSAGGGGSGAAAGSAGSGGSAGSPECVLPIKDDFDDGKIDALWTVFDASPGFPPLEAQGRLTFTFPPESPSGIYAALKSTAAYDLSDCSVFVQATSVPSPKTEAYLHLAVSDGANYVELLKSGTLLAAKRWVDKTTTFAANEPYDPVAHAWWKIREQGGTIHFEVSSDGKSYTSYAAIAAPFDPKAIYIWLAAGTWQPESNPGGASFDNLDLAP